MSKANLKVTFAPTETDFLMKVYSIEKGKWLRIGQHVDVQQLLFSRTQMQMGLQLAYNCFYSKFEWKKEWVIGEKSIDVGYGCSDAIATYKIAQKVILDSELIFAHNITIFDKNLMQQQIDNNDDNVSDVSNDAISLIELEDDSDNACLTDIVEVGQEEQTKFSIHNDFICDGINFAYVDYKFADHMINLGLINQRYNKIQFKEFYLRQNSEYKNIFKQILDVFLKQNKLEKQLQRQEQVKQEAINKQNIIDQDIKKQFQQDQANLERLLIKPMLINDDELARRNEDIKVSLEFRNQMKKDQECLKLNNVGNSELIENVNEEQIKNLKDFRYMIGSDSSAINRMNNGSVLQELTNKGVKWDLDVKQTGLAHQPKFDVTLVVEKFGINIKQIGINKSVARNNAIKTLTQLLL